MKKKLSEICSWAIEFEKLASERASQWIGERKTEWAAQQHQQQKSLCRHIQMWVMFFAFYMFYVLHKTERGRRKSICNFNIVLWASIYAISFSTTVFLLFLLSQCKKRMFYGAFFWLLLEIEWNSQSDISNQFTSMFSTRRFGIGIFFSSVRFIVQQASNIDRDIHTPPIPSKKSERNSRATNVFFYRKKKEMQTKIDELRVYQ